ncbi:MAG TPA: AMP-binding protein [Candidatus Angelobacter sp.]|nr:AMP-binding protein [Candidatus Angelobacter sp.]
MSSVIHPFDESGITRGADGIARYQNRPRSLVEMLRLTLDKFPTNEAVVEVGGERLTYRDLWDRSARTAGGLRAAGIQPGDRVAIRLGNGADWCVAFWAIQMAGAVVVPVNTRFTEPEVEYVVNDSGSRFVFQPGQPLPQGNSLVVENLEYQDVAAIFYTSGTTGFPKGAMTTHEGFLSNIETCRRMSLLPFDGSTRTLVSVPLFHVTGCNSQFLVACEGGSATVIMPAFNVQSFLKLIEAERINTLTSVPAVYWLAINQPNFREVNTAAVIRVSYGGAPIAPDLVGRIIEAFPNARVANGFGLTECSSVATMLPHEYARLRPETVGFAAPVVDLKLEHVLPGSNVGELLIRGPNVVKGYWNKPEATAETFAGGWLRTGDMARLDEQGFVQIVDRKKDMVNRGGENVYCVEVENALAAHPAVFEVAVVGVPDKMMGEKVGAAIVLKPGANAEAGDILQFAKKHLADFKVPQYLVLRAEALPRNPSGKILKKNLRENLEWGKQLW